MNGGEDRQLTQWQRKLVAGVGGGVGGGARLRLLLAALAAAAAAVVVVSYLVVGGLDEVAQPREVGQSAELLGHGTQGA